MNQPRLSSAILICDLLWCAVALAGALVLRHGTALANQAVLSPPALPFLALTWVIWVFLFRLLALDGFRGGWRPSAVVAQLLLAVCGLSGILLGCGYLFRMVVFRPALPQFGLLLFAGFVGIRLATYGALRRRAKHGGASRVVVVGRGPLVEEFARKARRHPEMLCQVVGILAPDDGTFAPFPVLGDSGPRVSAGALGMVELLTRERIEELILVLQECAAPDLLNLTALCHDRGIKVSLVPQLYELYLSRPDLIDLGGLPVLQLARLNLGLSTQLWKRGLDLFLGSLLAIAVLPILLPLAAVLRYFKGHAFHWERRCGFQGKPFRMLRLNIDRAPTERAGFESILHTLSLADLPQLWNVLRGEMSLVGPRPESPERVCRYSEWQRQRLTLKPGMTGWAQVEGLREQHSSEEKARFDLQYLQNLSLWTDLSLLLQTIWTVAARSANWEGAPAGANAWPKVAMSEPMPQSMMQQSMKQESMKRQKADGELDPPVDPHNAGSTVSGWAGADGAIINREILENANRS